MTAVVIPEAPAIVGNDVTNVLVPSVGVDITKLEVSLDGGLTYSPFNIATTYLGNKTVLVRVMALDPHPAGKTTEVRFTNSAPAITSGSFIKKLKFKKNETRYSSKQLQNSGFQGYE
jgi:hypothetical protein